MPRMTGSASLSAINAMGLLVISNCIKGFASSIFRMPNPQRVNAPSVALRNNKTTEPSITCLSTNHNLFLLPIFRNFLLVLNFPGVVFTRLMGASADIKERSGPAFKDYCYFLFIHRHPAEQTGKDFHPISRLSPLRDYQET